MQGAQGVEEVIYNGIKLPAVWPPRNIVNESGEPPATPYLDNPPSLIPIDVGRQLFVDNFLVETSDLHSSFHYPEKYEGNPVLRPETAWEKQGMAAACPKSGGVWWDYDEKIFKMWYGASFFNGSVCYATSEDGLRWNRPGLDIEPGTNRVSPLGVEPDSWTVVPDYWTTDRSQKYKIFLREPGCGGGRALCYMSPDGLHWGYPVASGLTDDRSTMFFNPFRRKWCFSLRSGYGWDGWEKTGLEGTRTRHYRESSDFLEGTQWIDWRPGKGGKAVPWAHADKFDLPDPEIGRPTQLYNLDAVAYESLMLGFFEIHRGPANADCAKVGLPKITELNFAYSRDGFHWHRPDRAAAIRAERRDVWDRGYVQSVGNICTVRKDKIWFYYIGTQGNPERGAEGVYDRCSTGVAFLRRDGFVSMDAIGTGHLTTRLLTFGGKHLFVNVDAPDGELKVEALDAARNPIKAFSMENCEPLTGDTTSGQIHWKSGDDLSALNGKPVRFRFKLTRGKLYSFWVSKDATGRSDGYVAGGGPDFTGPTDTVGNRP